jgi:hypothetical protein
MDKQHAQAVWTWMMHSNSEWTYNLSMQHAQAARTSSRDSSIRIDLFFISLSLIVPDPDKGVCADPVNVSAILAKGGLEPQGGNKERQLSPDKGRVKT